MATPKGSAGYALFGDKSAEFYKDPIAFVSKKMEEHDARIFQSRILNKPTVFVCTVKGVKDLLVGKENKSEVLKPKMWGMIESDVVDIVLDYWQNLLFYIYFSVDIA